MPKKVANKTKFTIEPKYEKKLKDGKQIGISVRKQKKQFIKLDEIRKFYNDLTENNENKVIIRALGPDRWSTLASLEHGLNVLDYEDYYRGKVKDTGKFAQFSELEVVVLTPNKK